jgi:hypothetical protein
MTTAHGIAINPVALGPRWLGYVSSTRLPYTANGGVCSGIGGVGVGQGLAEQAVKLVQEGSDSMRALAAKGVKLLNENMNGTVRVFDHGLCCVRVSSIVLRRLVRCAFSDRELHS